jgi:hypothetical protein
MASLKRQIFENRVITQLNYADDADFLNGIEDVSRYVTGDDEAQIINRTVLGVKPEVLINNTTYPIDEQAITDENVPIALDKYQTKATPISDDDMYASTYDRVDAINRSHVEAITEKKYDKAAHSLAPAGHTADTPVILTTGADDGTGRKKLTKADVISLRRALGKKLRKGLRLVLCSDHVNDILEWDENFDKQYANREEGLITKKYGFEIYEYAENPYYTVATKTKKSFGAVPTSGDMMASFVFYAPRAVMAKGKTKLYMSESAKDPLRQRNLMNYRHYFIAMRTENKLCGALVSGTV